jgi:hypothetical protein
MHLIIDLPLTSTNDSKWYRSNSSIPIEIKVKFHFYFHQHLCDYI